MLDGRPDWCTPAHKSFLATLKPGDVVSLCCRQDGMVHRLPVEVTATWNDVIRLWSTQVARSTGHSNLKKVCSPQRLFWVEQLGGSVDVRLAECLAPALNPERQWWLHHLKPGDVVRYWRSPSGLTKDLSFEMKVITRSIRGSFWLQPQVKHPSGSVQIRCRTGFAKNMVAWIEPTHYPTDLGDRLAMLEATLPPNDYIMKTIQFNDRQSW